MKMDELINELRDMYQDGDNKELFEETVDFFYELYNKSETIRELVDDNDINPTLEGKKGILYLDSGNHFEIKEKKTTTE